MQVHRDDTRRMLEQRQVVIDGAAVVGLGWRVFQVADMVRHHCPAFLQQAEAVLQLTPEGQHGRRRFETGRHGNSCGRQAAGTPQHARHSLHNPHDRVVHTARDVTVMQQEIVRDATQAPLGLMVAGRLRLVGQVAAGQHDGALHAAQHQVVQRCIGQHESKRLKPWRDAHSHPGAARAGGGVQQHDRSGRALQQRRLGRRDVAVLPYHVQIARHQRERFATAVFAFAQPRHGDLARGIAGQLEAAQPLDGDDLAAL